jgi:hypothetical protein
VLHSKRQPRRKATKNISEYIRFLHAEQLGKESGRVSALEANEREYPASLVQRFLTTENGEIFWGDSRGFLFGKAKPNSVDLIMTSRPSALFERRAMETKTQISIAIGFGLLRKAFIAS